ncbi:unnamed protein product, partial [Phyllotreta striolata]
GSTLSKPASERSHFAENLETWNEFSLQNPEELGSFIEGDLIIINNNLAKNGIMNLSKRWENGIIPFEIKGWYKKNELALIYKAIDYYHNFTCIRFRPRSSGDDSYISITSGQSGCWSSVGNQGKKQIVNLQSPQCVTKIGTILHELMHVIGFVHEQSRHERDDYVTINWNNIKSSSKDNFKKSPESYESGFDVPYDYESVMHYSRFAFSANGQPTIIPKVSYHYILHMLI